MFREVATDRSATWSLRRRLTMLIAFGVAVLLATGTSLVAWFLDTTLQRELDSLAVEELAEFEVAVMQGPVDAERLAQVASELDSAHTEMRLSVRIWRLPYEKPWLTIGARPTNDWLAEPLGRDEVTSVRGHLQRARTTSIRARLKQADGSEKSEILRAELLVDGTPRAKDLERVTALFLLIALFGGAATIIGGALFSRHLARLLEQVAESAAAARLDADVEPRAPRAAPVEIHRVATAMSESVEAMRAQHRRNVLLTAGLAHELRSPLQNLISEAEVALLRPRDEAEYRRLMGSQLEELRALALVVDNLITLTALRDTQTLPRNDTFDLAHEIGMRLSHEESEAARRGIAIDVDHKGDCTVHGDREALVLMLRNLIGNAVRWTRDDSVVEVEIDGRGDMLELTVDDSGVGVPPSEREAIFEAFYQGQSPTGRRAGYGLGLALARAAARSHGGDIAVGSAASGGARFTVRLPRTLSVASDAH